MSPSVLKRFLCFLEEMKKVLRGKMRSKANVHGCKFRHGDNLFGGNIISGGQN